MDGGFSTTTVVFGTGGADDVGAPDVDADGVDAPCPLHRGWV